MATCKVDFPYKAKESHELSLEVGDLIRNCVRIFQISNYELKKGFFTGKYLYSSSSETFFSGWRQGDLNGRTGMFPDNCATQIEPKPKTKTKQFVAAFKHVARNDRELSFEIGDIIMFKRDIKKGWTKVEIENGDSGFYPTNFVKVIISRFHTPFRDNFTKKTFEQKVTGI